MRDKYHPLFEQYGVDIVLYGHAHTYERTYPLAYNKANSSKPIMTNNSNGSYNDPEGQIFVTVGTAGQSIHHHTSKDWYIVTQYQGYAFLDIEITGNKLVGKFYSNKGGPVKDQFTITK